MLSGTRGVHMATMGFPWALPSVHTAFIEKEVLEGTLKFLVYSFDRLAD